MKNVTVPVPAVTSKLATVKNFAKAIAPTVVTTAAVIAATVVIKNAIESK